MITNLFLLLHFPDPYVLGSIASVCSLGLQYMSSYTAWHMSLYTARHVTLASSVTSNPATCHRTLHHMSLSTASFQSGTSNSHLDMVDNAELAPAQFFPLVVMLFVEVSFLQVYPRHLPSEALHHGPLHPGRLLALVAHLEQSKQGEATTSCLDIWSISRIGRERAGC